MNSIYRAYIYIGLSLSATIGMQAQMPEQTAKAQLYYYEGVKEASQGHTKEALDLYRHAYSLDSTDAELCYALGVLMEKELHSDKSLDLVAKAYALDSTNRDITMYYVGRLSQGNDSHLATEVLDRWCRQNPTDNESLQLLSYLCAQSQDSKRAFEVIDQLRTNNKDVPSEYARWTIIKSRLYDAMDRHEESLAEVRRLTSELSHEPSALLVVISYLQERGYHKETLPLLQNLEETNVVPSATLLPLYIEYYKAVRDVDAWEQTLRRLLDDPDAEAEQKIGYWLSYLQSIADTDVLPDTYNWVFDKILSVHPEETKVRLTYSSILESQGHKVKAIELLQELTKVIPEDVEVWTRLIFLLVSEERYLEEPAVAEQALKYHPEDWRIYFYTSISYYLQGKPKEAFRFSDRYFAQIQKGEVNEFGASQLYAHQGDMHDALGNKQKAIEAYDQALKYDASNIGVLNNYAYLLAMQGKDLEQAERMALKGISIDKDNENLLDTYAWILYLRKKYTLADLYMRKALEAVKEDATKGVYYDHYGHIQLALGNKDEARKQWSKALEEYDKELNEAQSPKEKKKVQDKIKALKNALTKVEAK